jgi:hypothetical protein
MTGRNIIQAQVAPTFGLQTGGLGVLPLVIEGDPGFYQDTDTHLLVTPAVGATLRATVGTLTRGNVKPVDVPGGMVQFSGSNTATLPRVPVYSSPLFNILFAFDMEGQPTSIAVVYDASSYQVRANKPCYAAVAYTPFKTSGEQYTYQADLQTFGNGSITTFGVIAAFYPPKSITTYQVPPSNVDGGEVDVEVYRRVSYAVTTPDGEFEKPPQYPTLGTYPDRPLVIDTGTSLRTERVHEIGFITEAGRAYVRSFYVPIREPYVGDAQYATNLAANLECKVSTLPQALDPALVLKAKNFIKSRGLGCR